MNGHQPGPHPPSPSRQTKAVLALTLIVQALARHPTRSELGTTGETFGRFRLF